MFWLDLGPEVLGRLMVANAEGFGHHLAVEPLKKKKVYVPERAIMAAYNDCVQQIFPQGIGSCTDGELYTSSADRTQLNKCIRNQVPMPTDSSSEEGMDPFMDCVKALGQQCKNQSS
ncbi:hypothetical protein CDAR_467921 [Caerostris darwini]|uniref:Uncharacterized protein n=1 Tax=Caerostris darwini TaxID=1538125 RepID=A0AAV4MRW0_9ARAC|nr:hypothetical protein CDAR_467921 [Caerostris darwini]